MSDRMKVRVSLPLSAPLQEQLISLGCDSRPYMTIGNTTIFAATCNDSQLQQLHALDGIQVQAMPIYTVEESA